MTEGRERHVGRMENLSGVVGYTARPIMNKSKHMRWGLLRNSNMFLLSYLSETNFNLN